MMLRVLASPVREGREGAQAAEPADDRVGATRPEERAMPAIVLNDEHAHHESPSRYGEGQHEPRRNAARDVHGGAAREKGTERCCKLQEALPPGRMRERGGGCTQLGLYRIRGRTRLHEHLRPSPRCKDKLYLGLDSVGTRDHMKLVDTRTSDLVRARRQCSAARSTTLDPESQCNFDGLQRASACSNAE